MTKIESQKIEIENSAEKVFNYLTNFNNFKNLMPPQVTDWTSTDSECSFNISGMAKIGMKIVDKTPHSSIKIDSTKGPVKFSLFVLLQPNGEKSNGQIVLESDLNPMMKMMAEKPLTNFVNLLAEQLKNVK